MKTMRDAVVEMKGDLSNSRNRMDNGALEDFHIVYTDGEWNVWHPFWVEDGERQWYSVGTVAEFKRGCASVLSETLDNLEKVRQALENLMQACGGGGKICGHDFDCVCPYNQASEALDSINGGRL